MKTAELIKQLQDADPEGILEVVSGAEDTFYVECAPSYYDGNLFYVVRDPNIKGYNVKEAVISRAGYKVNIRTIGIRDVLMENPDLPVTFMGFSIEREKEELKNLEHLREEMRGVAF